jgi:undecaprenyl phosphate-alpha-L-ara4FN deformylase
MSFKIGLRIDVDTFRGTRDGVPALCSLFKQESIKASFFFSVGPDNMGKHLWRLLKPTFLIKMLRTKAASLYGWDIIFKGTFWPGPLIGLKLKDIIKAASDDGHEIGLHAWDHQKWQAKVDSMTSEDIFFEIKKGVDALNEIGVTPECSAVPGWKCTDQVLLEKEKFPFKYNSDSRGEKIFAPLVDGKVLKQPQVPVSLPTYDEVLGKNGITNENYNEFMIGLLDSERLNVLTIHAEAEGILCLDMFKEFIAKARGLGFEFVPLNELLEEASPIESAELELKEIPGREGWLACINPLVEGEQ